MEGRYFLYPFTWLRAQFPGHCGCTEWEPVSYTTSVKWGIQSSETRPFFWEAQGGSALLLGEGEAWALSGHCKEQELPYTHVFPEGGCRAHQPTWGVTNVYQCTQTKCQILFLAHDLEKRRWAALILLFLTTTANLTPISLDCHENLPWEK